MATNEDLQSLTGRTSANLATNQLENIKVAVRLRPFTDKERQRNNRRILDVAKNTIVLYSPKQGDVNLKKFTFDYSYWSHDGFKRDSNGVNIPDLTHQNCEKYVGQEKVFEDLGQFLLTNALQGYNSALLAYGPTGSGKSYTVSGYGQNEGILPRLARALFVELDKKAKVLNRNSNEQNKMTNSNTDAEHNNPSKEESIKENDSTCNNRYEVYFSMIEIYNEVVRDLLAKNHGDIVTQSTFARRGLKVREHPKHGFFVENLTSYACADKNEIERRIEEGQLNKSIAATSMNESSSRGHTIYEFRIKQYKLKSPESPEETLTTSLVQLVDLAGSERMAVHVTGQLGGDSFIGSRSNSPYPKSGNEKINSTRNARLRILNSASSTASSAQQSSSSVTKKNSQNNNSLNTINQQRFKESVSINQSLSALGNCIQVMSQYSQQFESNSQIKRPKIPYRDSVLTKLLNRCCLSGNSKVVIIATLSPADTNYDDSLSTLRFADRAKQIRTHAIVNRMSRSRLVDDLQKENERLKQMVDGRITTSDDSSQTSNFDDSENVMENFTGSKIRGRASKIDAMATPIRSRTINKKTREILKEDGIRQRNLTKLISSSKSNPSLIVKEQMKRLVSPASQKLINDDNDTNNIMRKSRSMGHGLSGKLQSTNDIIHGDDFELREIAHETGSKNVDGALNEVELNDLGDIKKDFIGPDSDDSFAALADEDLSNEEKIGIYNRLLSNSTVNKSFRKEDKKSPTKTKIPRPKKANRLRAGIKQVSILSSSLKKSNPYLSNLNPDEQLTGMISYIIKQGENILGKNNDCDIVLHGPELRGQHAKITRSIEKNPIKESDVDIKNENESASASMVYIEPILDLSSEVNEQKYLENDVAIVVNGSPLTKKTLLNHCDRLLLGTNSYFVFVDNMNQGRLTSDTIANLDLVTFDMARNEVLRKVMTEAKNEAMIKEINDYTHRPGTGKHRVKSEEFKERANRGSVSRVSKVGSAKLTRSMTIQDQENVADQLIIATEKTHHITENTTKIEENLEESILYKNKGNDIEDQEANYRDQLMEDTYEYALPVAEINAVAKEMGIKVTYGLKILTGEEQPPDQITPGYIDSSNSDGFSSSSIGDGVENDRNRVTSGDGYISNVTHLTKLDVLDIAPALYIKVYLEELDLDFYWSKEKFQARRYKILELYGAWDVGGKSGLVELLIEESKTHGDYLIDPFVDDPNSTIILIGYSQITLQPISHLSDIKQNYDILNMNDEIVGSISIEVIPCHDNSETKSDDEKLELYRPFNDEDLTKNLLENPKDLLDPDSSVIKTKVLCEDSIESENSQENLDELSINHSHFICFEKVNQDTLDFLEHGFVTIQVIGQYKLSESTNRSPTVISTIIRSINKYKFKLEQQHSYGMNYPSSVYCNSNTDSAKSNQGPSSGAMNNNSGSGSVVSNSATVNLFDQQNEDDEGINSINELSQENIIDMILTKRKLDRAENQLIPVKTVKKLLNSYGNEIDNGSLEEIAADVTIKGRSANNKHSACSIQ